MTGKSLIEKRSIEVSGSRTSLSIEQPFWDVLKEVAGLRGIHLNELVTEINHARVYKNLSSVLRVYVLEWVREQAAAVVDVRSVRPS